MPANILRRLAAYGIDVFIAFAGVVALQALVLPVNPLLGGDASTSGVVLHIWVTLTVTLPILPFFGRSRASRSGATPA